MHHSMPHGLTLLSIRRDDGSETLGVRTGRGILDVKAAARHLSRPSPLTLEGMLHQGSAAEIPP